LILDYLEHLEHSAHVLFCHADPSVLYGNLETLLVLDLQGSYFYFNVAIKGELDGVTHEVEEDLLEPLGFGAEGLLKVGTVFCDQLYFPTFSFGLHNILDIIDNFPDVNGFIEHPELFIETDLRVNQHVVG